MMPVATTRDERIAQLKQKLKAREGKSEYKTNVPKLREEIARLEGKQEFDL